MRTAAVIPAYNEETRVADVVRGAVSVVDLVIVVDDCSTDRTAMVSEEAGAQVIRHIQNCGAGAATMTGLKAARMQGYEIAVTLDADGQHDHTDIKRLLAELESSGADLVIANRFGHKNRIPFVRRIANGLGNWLTFFVTGIYLQDTQCGFKVFGPKALKQVEITMPGFEFCTEIIREAARFHWKITSIPSKVLYSEYTLAKGQSFANGLRTAAKILLRSFLR